MPLTWTEVEPLSSFHFDYMLLNKRKYTYEILNHDPLKIPVLNDTWM